MSDSVKCANVQANGGSCTYPACNCAEPPKSKSVTRLGQMDLTAQASTPRGNGKANKIPAVPCVAECDSVLFVTVAVSVDATPENVLTRTLSGTLYRLEYHRGPGPRIKLAPAKVFPSNDRDGVKGPPQECRPPMIGMGRRLNRALQICSFQADGTKAPRHGAGLCVALGISTRFNARDGETNVRPHPPQAPARRLFETTYKSASSLSGTSTSNFSRLNTATVATVDGESNNARTSVQQEGAPIPGISHMQSVTNQVTEQETLSGRRQSSQSSARLSPVVEGEDAMYSGDPLEYIDLRLECAVVQPRDVSVKQALYCQHRGNDVEVWRPVE
ncbi:predicted protein [Postia placenta Mad-698-R]|nr:predicted protein [Postia placenta Mad-698-R]